MSGIETIQDFKIDRSMYDDANPEEVMFKAAEGINEELVREISKQKNEPEWMLQKRLEGLRWFLKTPLPDWGPSLERLDLNQIEFKLQRLIEKFIILTRFFSYFIKPIRQKSKKSLNIEHRKHTSHYALL